jgi:hypothetical protein
MSSTPQRLPARWIVISIGLIGLAVLLIGLKFWVNTVEASRWEKMRIQLADLAREARARDGRRPVLRGSPLPGNAWDDYEAGFLSIKSWPAL